MRMSPYKEKPVTVKITVDGKPYWVRGKTEREARAKAERKKADIEAGRVVVSPNMTVETWADKWLKMYTKKSNARDLKDKEGMINNWIVPVPGVESKTARIKRLPDQPTIRGKKIKSVRQVHLQEILNYMEACGCSASYIKKVRDIMHAIFARAKENKLILDNPTEGLQLPKGTVEQRRSITDRERELTLQVAETNRGGLFVLIMLYTGLRPGEVAALRWSNVDMDNQIVHVRRAIKADGTEGGPKSKAGVRDVPIPDVLHERLAKIEHEPNDLVCTTAGGEQHNRDTIRQMWNNFVKDMNIAAGCKTVKSKYSKHPQPVPPFAIPDDLTLYCYRHTYGTDLQAAGVPINVAKEFMGHENILITAQIYTHHSADSFNDAASKINAYQRSKVAPEVAK